MFFPRCLQEKISIRYACNQNYLYDTNHNDVNITFRSCKKILFLKTSQIYLCTVSWMYLWMEHDCWTPNPNMTKS